MDIECLPNEILELVFKKMFNSDLCNVILVNRRWKDVGENIWKCNILRIDVKNAKKLSNMNRLRNVKWIQLRSNEKWTNKKFQLLCNFSKLDDLSFLPFVDISNVNSKLVANVCRNLHSMYLWDLKMTKKQLIRMFSSLVKLSKLKNLEMMDQDLKAVPKDIISTFINNLEDIYCDGCSFT